MSDRYSLDLWEPTPFDSLQPLLEGSSVCIADLPEYPKKTMSPKIKEMTSPIMKLP